MRIRKWLKALAGAVAGLLLLDLFCAWYYNPAGYVRDDVRATELVREPGRFTSRANEGFSWSVIDENGYNNREVPGEDGVFVLMMGSSHTEGFYTLPGDDVSSQLSDQLAARGLGGTVYNIGMSGHHLVRNIFNLDRALTRFEPSGYVVLETRTVKYGARAIYSALEGNMERYEETQVVISKWLSERPLLRAAYRQLMALYSGDGGEDGQMGEEEIEGEIEGEEIEAVQELADLYLEKMTELFRMARETAEAHGVTPIIYYHPTLLLQEDGSAVPVTNNWVLSVFAEACEAAGVTFIDMTDRFLEAYEWEHILPYGFVNTAPGAGHLNAQGCRMVAEAVCEEIARREAEK